MAARLGCLCRTPNDLFRVDDDGAGVPDAWEDGVLLPRRLLHPRLQAAAHGRRAPDPL